MQMDEEMQNTKRAPYMYRTSPQAQLRKSSLDLPALGEPCQLCANWNVLDATWVCPVTGLTTVHAEMEYQFGEAGPHSTVQTAAGVAVRTRPCRWLLAMAPHKVRRSL